MHTPKSARTAEISSLAIVPLQWTAAVRPQSKNLNNTVSYTIRLGSLQRSKLFWVNSGTDAGQIGTIDSAGRAGDFECLGTCLRPFRDLYATCLAYLGYAHLPDGDRARASRWRSHNTGMLSYGHHFRHASSQNRRYVHLCRSHRRHREVVRYGLDRRKPSCANRRYDLAWRRHRRGCSDGDHRGIAVCLGDLLLNHEISHGRVDRDVGSLCLAERLKKKLIRRSGAGLPE